ELIRALKERGIDVRVWGPGWERFADLRTIAGGPLPTEIMIETICASRIVLGLAWCSDWKGSGPKQPQIKGRTFEYPACGAFQITFEDPRLGAYFRIGEEVVTFRDEDDLAAKIRYYLEHEHEREAIAEAALDRVLREHTWEQRWRTFFADVAANPPAGKRHLQLPTIQPTAPAPIEQAPLVSVITYVYNIAEYLDELVQSVQGQTFQDFEFVIIDDGSTDHTPEVIAPYLSDPRIRYFRQENIGSTGRFDLLIKAAMERARGELIAFIGGDDICMPERLEHQVREFMADPELDIVHSNGHNIDPEGRRLDTDFRLPAPYNAWTMTRILFIRNLVAHPTVMMRRRCFDRVGPFEQGFAADYHYWLKSARFLKYRYLHEKLVAYRIHPKSASTTAEGLRKAALEAMRLVRHMRGQMTILDLYPELSYCRDQEAALCAAYVDFGNMLLVGNYKYPDLAWAEYQRALEHSGGTHPLVLHNMAIALRMSGHPDEARSVLADLARLEYAPAVKSLQQLERGALGADCLLPARHLSEELFTMPAPAGANVWTHDGQLLDKSYRIVLASDWQPDGSWKEALLAYCAAFEPKERVELCMPTLGRDAQDVERLVLETLEEGGYSPEAVADLEIVDAPSLELVSLPLDLVIPQAQDLVLPRYLAGRTLSGAPTVDTLRLAFARKQRLTTVPTITPTRRPGARFRFLVPVRTEGDLAGLEPVLTHYLQAAHPTDPVSLMLWIGLPTPAEAIAELVERACANAGLSVDGEFADVDVELGRPAWEDLLELMEGSEALLLPGPATPELRAAAESFDLPLIEASSPELLRSQIEDWNPTAIDIVLLTHNRLNYLRQTVEALFERTQHPFRLTIVDNASDPDILAYLKAERPRFHRVIRNAENRWTEAFTQGIAVSRSDPFIVSDPDILVPALTPCWLSRMLDLMDRHPEMGMVALNLDAANKPANLPDVYISDKAPHGPDLTLSNVGTVMQTIRRKFFTPPYTTDWQTVEAIRRNGGLVGFANHLVGYHLGWDEERDYPEHLLKKHQYFNRNYGSNLYTRYTQDPSLLAAMSGKPLAPVASIVVLTYNQLEFTKLCLESVLQHTDVPFELIVVDNASNDGTPDYLRALAEQHPNVRAFLNQENRGFAGGCNQGIAQAQGQYIVLLNNDTVVSTKWLSRMIEVAQLEGVGMVGPRTNCIVGPQEHKDVPYDLTTLEGFDDFARAWHAENYRQVWESPRVIGFCVLIRREVIDRIGGLDTRYRTGNYEDDDYCARAKLAGFKIMVTDEVFIHHFGSVTFRKQKIDYRQLMLENWQRFKDKWMLAEDQRPEDGYLFADLMALPFDPGVHTEPIFSPAVEPVSLPDSSGFNIVLAEEDQERLAGYVAAFVQAFAEGDDVTLHVLASGRLESAQAIILSTLASHGKDPEHIPTISLLDDPAAPMDLPQFLKAANLVVGGPQVLRGAADMGLAILEEPSIIGLQEARARQVARQLTV
ncbi:MAG TPA: glycosyltransferase, partial [Stenomitos sp.]